MKCPHDRELPSFSFGKEDIPLSAVQIGFHTKSKKKGKSILLEMLQGQSMEGWLQRGSCGGVDEATKEREKEMKWLV